MASTYGERIIKLMSEEMGTIGPFIMRKQCKNLGIDPDDVQQRNLPPLASALAEAMRSFGSDRGQEVYKKIQQMHNLDEIVGGEKDISKKIEGLLDLGNASRFSSSHESAKYYYIKALNLAKRENASEQMTQAYTMLGLLANDQNEPEDALGYFQKAMRSSEEKESKKTLALINRGIGYGNWRLGEYDSSKAHYEKAMSNARDADDRDLMGILNIDLGLLQETLGEYHKALESFRSAISILGETDNKYNLARAHNNTGEIYKHMDKLESAIDEYEQCYKLAEEAQNKRMMGFALGNSAECYAKLGELDKARDYAKRTLDIFEKQGDEYMISGVHLTYGIINMKAWDTRQMKISFEKALRMLRRLNYPYEIGTNTYEYAKALKHAKEYKAAKKRFEEALDIFIKLGSEQFIDMINKELEELEDTA